MSKKAVETFLKTLDENGPLNKEFLARMPKATDPARVVAFASAHGFDFTEDELEQHAASFAATPPAGELSDQELNAVVGGVSSFGLTPYGGTSTQVLRDTFFSGVAANRLA